MTPNARRLGLIAVLVVLIGASIFIGYQLYTQSQAPDDAAAGGGGGACNATSTGVGTPGQIIDKTVTGPCCNNLGWFDVTPDGSGGYTQCKYEPDRAFCPNGAKAPTAGSCPSGQYVPAGSSGSACQGNPAPGTVWVATNVANDGRGAEFCCLEQPIGQCYYFGGSGGNELKCDCGCKTTEEFCAGKDAGTYTDTCVNCGNKVTYQCGGTTTPPGENPPPPGENPPPPDNNPPPPPPVVKKICGESCSSNSDCAPASTGAAVTCRNGRCEAESCAPGQTIHGSRCDCATNTRRCGERCGYYGNNQLCGGGTSCAYVNGPSCTGGFTNATAGPTYCAPTSTGANNTGPSANPNVSRQKCVGNDTGNGYVIVAGQPASIANLGDARIKELLCNYCGNGTLETGEQCDEGAANGSVTSGCTASCVKKTVTSDVAISIIKESSLACGPANENIVSYTVTVTNIGSEDATYSQIVDKISLSGPNTQFIVSNISNGGTAVGPSGDIVGSTITWAGGTLEPGEVLKLTYTVTVPMREGSDALTNEVTVTYTDGNNQQQENSYTNSVAMECRPGGKLPETGIEDWGMYILAAGLMLLAIIVYRRRVGEEQFTQILNGLGSRVEKALFPTRKFESDVLKDQGE